MSSRDRNTNIPHTDATRETQDGQSDYWVIGWPKHQVLTFVALVASFGLLVAFTAGALMGHG